MHKISISHKKSEINEKMGKDMMNKPERTDEDRAQWLYNSVTMQLNNTKLGPERQLSSSECVLLLQ